MFTNGRKLVEPAALPTDVPTMPIEFSVAGFRLGHSMVRATYDWNRRFPGDAGSLFYMFDFSALGGTLGGNLKLASNWIADWRRMYDFPDGGHPGLAGPNGVNRAQRIDTMVADPLKFLPTSVFGEKEEDVDFNDPARNLAFRNLMRGSMLNLASGQQMVAHLRSSGSTSTAHPAADPQRQGRGEAHRAVGRGEGQRRPAHAVVVLHPA